MMLSNLVFASPREKGDRTSPLAQLTGLHKCYGMHLFQFSTVKTGAQETPVFKMGRENPVFGFKLVFTVLKIQLEIWSL